MTNTERKVKPLRCKIYEEQLRGAELFGKPVLYTEKQIQRESVPEGWHCYECALFLDNLRRNTQ